MHWEITQAENSSARDANATTIIQAIHERFFGSSLMPRLYRELGRPKLGACPEKGAPSGAWTCVYLFTGVNCRKTDGRSQAIRWMLNCKWSI